VSSETLSRRELNRATLARQLLLHRAEMAAGAVIGHLVGMQAQAPNAPYVGLWTRLRDFDAGELVRLLTEHRAVRAPLMRATIHLVTSHDCVALRPLVQPVLERNFHTGSPFGRNVRDLDLGPVLAAGRTLLAEQPRSRAELGPLLAERWPGVDADTLAYAVTYLEPLVQVPPRGIWGTSGPAAWTTTAAWLPEPPASTTSLEELVVRYLGAFGPATVADVQAWSGLTRLREVVDGIRSRLRKFRDEDGRELFDLPGAPRPDPDEPAPPRFLPEYDNVQFGHADRSRLVPTGRKPPLFAGNGGVLGTVLVDGMLAGTWKITRPRKAGAGAVLAVEPYEPLPADQQQALAEEGARLLAFVAPDAATHDVRVGDPA
jgi:hypothetical protein